MCNTNWFGFIEILLDVSCIQHSKQPTKKNNYENQIRLNEGKYLQAYTVHHIGKKKILIERAFDHLKFNSANGFHCENENGNAHTHGYVQSLVNGLISLLLVGLFIIHSVKCGSLAIMTRKTKDWLSQLSKNRNGILQWLKNSIYLTKLHTMWTSQMENHPEIQLEKNEQIKQKHL